MCGERAKMAPPPLRCWKNLRLGCRRACAPQHHRASMPAAVGAAGTTAVHSAAGGSGQGVCRGGWVHAANGPKCAASCRSAAAAASAACCWVWVLSAGRSVFLVHPAVAPGYEELRRSASGATSTNRAFPTRRPPALRSQHGARHHGKPVLNGRPKHAGQRAGARAAAPGAQRAARQGPRVSAGGSDSGCDGPAAL